MKFVGMKRSHCKERYSNTSVDMNVWILLLIGLVLASILMYYFFVPKSVRKITATAIGPYDLNSNVSIIKNDTTTEFWKNDGGSFSAFIYLNKANRTAFYSPCASGSSCSNEDSICSCNRDSCVNCYNGQYKEVFNIGGILRLEVLVTPDASRQNQSSTRLAVQTEGNGNKYNEFIRLPNLDIQKWTCITICRDGNKRLNIFYNDTLILSKSLIYSISSVGALSETTSGSPGLDGKLIIANMYNYLLSTKDVSEKYMENADTRGRPYFNDPSNPMSLSDLGGILPNYGWTMFSGIASYIPYINICPEEGCFAGPSIKPANPLYEWNYTYA